MLNAYPFSEDEDPKPRLYKDQTPHKHSNLTRSYKPIPLASFTETRPKQDRSDVIPDILNLICSFSKEMIEEITDVFDNLDRRANRMKNY